MSGAFDTNSSDCLFATTNLASTVLQTLLVAAKFTALGGSVIRPLFSVSDAGPVHTHSFYIDSTGNLTVSQLTGSTGTFGASGSPTPGNPTYTNWNWYALTSGPAGAGSLVGYFRDNGVGAFTSLSLTGIASFTASQLLLAQVAANGAGPAAEFAYFREWDAVLTPTELLAESNSATVVRTANLRRNDAIASAANAGTDISGNGFNLTISGSLTDGLSLPTFPGASGLLLANANNGGF